MANHSEQGSYYIFEAGQLRTSAGRPLIPPNKKQRTQTEPQLVTRPYYDAEETATGQGLHTPPTLLNVAIGFVAQNLHLVESLIGFPDQVGVLLFKTASRKGAFRDNQKNLNLFSEAYGPCVLSEIIINSIDFLDTVCGLYSGLHNLAKLDLSGCKVGDNHRIIELIGQEFASLTHLSLADNELSSDGIRRLSTPCKMFGRGPKQLQVLNLSCNPYLSAATLKHLHCFKEMQLVDVSGNNAMADATRSKGMKGFSLLKRDQDLPSWYQQSSVCGIEGWADEVFVDWMQQQHENVTISHTASDTAALSTYGFYGHKRKKQKKLATKPSKVPRLILIASANDKDHNSVLHERICSSNKKTKKEVDREDSMEELFQGYMAPMEPKADGVDFQL